LRRLCRLKTSSCIATSTNHDGHASTSRLYKITEAVDNASPGTLREIVKTWIPQAVNIGAGIATLLETDSSVRKCRNGTDDD